MKCIDCVIIPARGGSKRIKRKNLYPFLGIPMLERSITLAREISNTVLVSSDDNEILEYAHNMGAYIIKRHATLADDNTPTLPVIIDALLHHLDTTSLHTLISQQDSLLPHSKHSQYDIMKNAQRIYQERCYHNDSPPFFIDYNTMVLCLYPTAMFATVDSIRLAKKKLLANNNIAYVVSILQQAKALRSFTLQNDYINFLFTDFLSTRTQDLPKTFIDAGQFYLGFARSFLHNIPILGTQSVGIELQYAWDIDTLYDLAIAEYLFNHIRKQQ